MHKEGQVSFAKVITFNLDEYYPMQPDSIHSYHKFMHENLFDAIDIPRENINIPDGTLPREQYEQYCAAYERKIKNAGGFDLALMGIGRTGHIGFNEPGSTDGTRTRLVLLDKKTRTDAASSFFGEKNVPYRAVTMGVGTILDAREIVLVATGEGKARIVQKTLEHKWEHPSECPASYLKDHPSTTFVFDAPAAQLLAQVKRPWEFDTEFDWSSFETVKKAIIYLSQITGKAICELSENDFHDHHLTSLVVARTGQENTDQLCLQVFNDLLHRIALLEDTRSEKLLPQSSDEKVLVFSPHPDDDVICMAGMMDKLIKKKVPVKAVYMTNGSVAVDDDILRDHIRFANMSIDKELIFKKGYTVDNVFQMIKEKREEGSVDPEIIQLLKGNVRKAEAINAVNVLGMEESDTEFLDLPFYRTGAVKKNPISEEDTRIVLDLLERDRPAHIFVAGDLTDPHGTHRMCYYAIHDAVDRYRANASNPAVKIWLYRGAWQEFDVEETSIFMPLSKAEMDLKINSIYKHQSQKDKALYPGNDAREFWQRALDRNRNNALSLKKLGLPTFFAAEAFVIVDTMPN